MIPLIRHLSRFRLARAGIHQVWQYDDEFSFGDGRLLLRGKNGACRVRLRHRVRA